MPDLYDLYSKGGNVNPAATNAATDVYDIWSNARASAAPVAITVRPGDRAQLGTDPATGNLAAVPVPADAAQLDSVPANSLARIPRDAVSAAAALPGQAWNTFSNEVVQGATSVDRGIRDIGNRNVATGVGNVGMGLLQIAGSPFTTAAKGLGAVATGVTGNPQFGENVETVAGLALPVAGAGAGAARAISNSLPSNKALRAAVDAIGAENVPAVVAGVRANPRLSVMDMSPEARLRGQRLTVVEGPHQGEFERFVRDRTEGAKASVTDAYDVAMGGTVNAHTKLNELRQSARNVGTAAIEPAIRGASPVNVTSVLDYVQNLARPGVNSVITAGTQLPPREAVREMQRYNRFISDGTKQRTNAADLHSLQVAVRARADDLLNSADGSQRQLGRALMEYRNQLVNTIDAASPRVTIRNPDGTTSQVGSYRQGLSQYRTEMDIQAAFDRGYALRRNRESVWEDHPDFVAEWVRGLSPQERQAAREGARLGFRDAIGRRNDPRGQQGTQIVNIDYNLDKARALFGDREINQMATKLRDERMINDTNTKLVEGSQTAMRSAADTAIPRRIQSGDLKADILPAAIAEGATYFASGVPGIGATLYTLNKLVGNPVRAAVRNRMTDRHNRELTNLLQATGADDVALNRMLDYASSITNRTSLRNRIGNSVSQATKLIP